MLLMTSAAATAHRLVLVPVAKTAGTPARPVRRYRLARLKPSPLPPSAGHLRRVYD
jgi:hypothetical protein